MFCAQASQVLELLLTGTSSRWRLNRVAADLSVIFGVRQAYFKQHAFGRQQQQRRQQQQQQQQRRRASAGVHGRDNDDDGDTSSPGWGRGRENSVAAVAAYSGGPNANDDDGYDYGYGGDGGGHRYADGGRVGAAWRGRRREDNDPWARPLQSYELKPLVLLWRFASRRLDGVLEAAWNRYANSNKNKNKNNQQEEREQEPRQQKKPKFRRRPRPRWMGGRGAPFNLRPLADMRNIAFAALCCAVAASPSLRATVLSWPVVVAVLTYLYFLRYPDRWFVFSKRVREMANDEWW